MKIPTVHLNGTSKDELIHQVRDAGQAVDAAIRLVEKCFPNGRDYYPQGVNAVVQATDEWRVRVADLRRVRDDLVAIYEGIESQAGRP